MLAMAPLLHEGLLGGMGGEAGGVDGSGEGAWTLATPLEGFLLHLCLFRELVCLANPKSAPNSQIGAKLSSRRQTSWVSAWP
jgi:hypothetical protein